MFRSNSQLLIPENFSAETSRFALFSRKRLHVSIFEMVLMNGSAGVAKRKQSGVVAERKKSF